MSKQNFIKGTFILTCTGLASRVIGFFIEYSCHILLVPRDWDCISLWFLCRTLYLPYHLRHTDCSKPSDRISDCLKASQRSKKYLMYRTSYRFLAFCGSLMDSVYKFRFFCRTDPEAAPDRTSAADSFLQFSFKRHSFMYQQLLFCQKKKQAFLPDCSFWSSLSG